MCIPAEGSCEQIPQGIEDPVLIKNYSGLRSGGQEAWLLDFSCLSLFRQQASSLVSPPAP